MIRRFLASALIVLASVSPALAERLPVTLKSATTIEGDMVKLGDLWENLGAKGETLLAPAPQPGKRIVADARWLTAVAEAYNVDWRPASQFDRIVIERSGQVIDTKLIEIELREALALEGVTGNFDLDLGRGQNLAIMVPAGQSGEIAVRDVMWDSRNNRFSATLEVPAGSPTAIRQKVSGRVFATSRVPVLTRPIARGEVITEKDVEWAEVRDELARRNIVSTIDELVGMEPRYHLRQGVPVRAGDVQRPILVHRNSLVTITLKTPFMSLTSQGKAVEQGGKGDVIHVINQQTKRTVEATVDGPGKVVVALAGTRQLSN